MAHESGRSTHTKSAVVAAPDELLVLPLGSLGGVFEKSPDEFEAGARIFKNQNGFLKHR